MMQRKILILDTSVLLYDMTAIHSFPGNDIIIPLVVLDEIDRFKDRPGLLGESARYVNRYLDKLRKKGRLDQAVRLPENDQTIKVEIQQEENLPAPKGLNYDKADNQIISTALYQAQKHVNQVVKVVTKDINLRVKCDALGLEAEDYYKDHVKLYKDKSYTGQLTVQLTDTEIDSFFSDGRLLLDPAKFKPCPNQFIVASGNTKSKSLLGTFKDGHVVPLNIPLNSMGIEAKNKEQTFALKLLYDPSIMLVTLTGLAGSGKTFLTLLTAMECLDKNMFKKIIVTRSIQPVGKDLGYLPGDLNDKMEPWLSPIIDNFQHAFKDLTYFDVMRDKGIIDVAPLSYMRGRTFNDAFVIVDEAQNMTIHELKTIITRVGKGSKVVLLGDTGQIDTPYLDYHSNGLTIVVEKFKDLSISGHIHLLKGQRSELASVASKIL